jgi:ketosteroid isomerase-like protein
MTQPSWQDEITRLEDECRVAFLAQDIERLRQMWSEELAVNSPLNRINSRAQVLDLLQRGIIRHVNMEQTIELITRHGDVAVVMGHDVVQNAPDQPQVRRRFTNIWRAADGSWQLIARQATLIPE